MRKKSEMKKCLRLLIAAGVLFLIIFTFSRSATLSEIYMQRVYPIIATLLSSISNILPFSLYGLSLLVLLLIPILLIIIAIVRKKSFLKLLCSLVKYFAIVTAWFYFSWGISYFRTDFYGRADIEKRQFNIENLKNFAVSFIENANRSYVNSDVMEKNGIRQEIENSYDRLHKSLRLPYPNGQRKVKPMLSESLFSKMGISGYFGPFFNEIHVNNYILNFNYPFTLAHEMAHQFGIAAESEANLYAFIVCTNSNDERIRYSAYISTLTHLLNDIRSSLPDEYNQLLSTIRPEIIEDLNRNREHWRKAKSETLSKSYQNIYDGYLKTNRISSGHANYSEVIGLLISSWEIFLEE